MGREWIAQKAFDVKGNGLPTKDLRGGGIDRAKSMWSTPDSNAKKTQLKQHKKSIHCINTQKRINNKHTKKCQVKINEKQTQKT